MPKKSKYENLKIEKNAKQEARKREKKIELKSESEKAGEN